MYPNPSVQLPSQYPVHPGDKMTALVSANSAGTSFTLMIKDAPAGWTFSTTQTGSGFARSLAEVIAQAPSSCSILSAARCRWPTSARSTTLGLVGGQRRRDQGIAVPSFNANEITMSSNGTTLATPSSLSSDGSSFSVAWNAS